MKITNVLSTLALAAMLAVSAFGQAATPSTTLTSAVNQTQTFVNLTAVTSLQGASNGAPANATWILFVDREEMRVISVSGLTAIVQRGSDGAPQQNHQSGATVFYGPAQAAPVGPWSDGSSLSSTCTASLYAYLPIIVTGGTSNMSGNQYNCPTSGPQANQWVNTSLPSAEYNSDGVFALPASDCVPSTTGAAGATTHLPGIVADGASFTPAVKSSVTNVGTFVVTFTCEVKLPTRQLTGKGVAVNSVTFLYGPEVGTLGTQAAVLASGTFNGSTVFSTITFPAAGASETVSPVTPVRADSGTLLITPVAASSNVTAVTAGQYYSVTFTPAAPIVVNSNLQKLLLTVTFQCAATTATDVTSPGAIVNYTAVQ